MSDIILSGQITSEIGGTRIQTFGDPWKKQIHQLQFVGLDRFKIETWIRVSTHESYAKALQAQEELLNQGDKVC